MTRSESGRIGGLKAKHLTEMARFIRELVYLDAPTRCAGCKAPLPYESRSNQYCTQSCAGTHTHTGKTYKKPPRTPCACGARVHLRNKWCEACIKAGLHIPVGHTNSVNIRSPNILRSYMLRTRPHSCGGCLRTEWEGQPIPLDVDHINGDSEDNQEENLRLICPNCHALTLNYKGRNRGHGRHARRKRYAEGKSY